MACSAAIVQHARGESDRCRVTGTNKYQRYKQRRVAAGEAVSANETYRFGSIATNITREEDLAEASRKLQALAGTIARTKAKSDAIALKRRLTKLVRTNNLRSGPPGDRTQDTVIKSHVLYH